MIKERMGPIINHCEYNLHLIEKIPIRAKVPYLAIVFLDFLSLVCVDNLTINTMIIMPLEHLVSFVFLIFQKKRKILMVREKTDIFGCRQ